MTNRAAISLYQGVLGYEILGTEKAYYADKEDAYDMRKALSRDVERKSIIPLPNPVYPDELD